MPNKLIRCQFTRSNIVYEINSCYYCIDGIILRSVRELCSLNQFSISPKRSGSSPAPQALEALSLCAPQGYMQKTGKPEID